VTVADLEGLVRALGSDPAAPSTRTPTWRTARTATDTVRGTC